MKPIVVTFVAPWGRRLGGADHRLATCLRRLDRAQTECRIVFLEDGPFADEIAGLGIPTAVIPAGRLRNLMRFVRTVRSMAARFKREQPDLILSWGAKSHLYGATAAMLAGCADRLAWWQLEIPSGQWLYRVATRLPTRSIACSSHFVAQQQRRIKPSRPTFVVAPGIDPPEPVPQTAAVSLREFLSIPGGRLVIGIVGRLQSWKGQDRVLRAVAELRRRGHPAHALVAGGDAYGLEPEYEAELQRLTKTLEITDYVTFTGHVEDPDPYFRLMDVCVSASRAEPFGIVIIEAMAHGVPVIAVNRAGPAEIIEHERSGLLIPEPDEDLIANAVERLVSDPVLRGRLAEGGLEAVKRCFTTERMVEHLSAELHDLALASQREANRDSVIG